MCANCYWDGGTKTFKPYTGIQASNYGASLDVCAIGEGSETVLAACTSGATNCAFGGTSSAAAAVSGTVALMLTAKYCLSSDQLRMVLAASTDPYDFTTPHGREYGTGVLNAFQAVTGAINTACP